MPNAADRGMIAIEDTSNPITIRFNLSTNFGVSSQELTVDVPALFNLEAETAAFANQLWRRTIALQLSHVVSLDFTEFISWKSSPLVKLGATGAPNGASFLPGTARADSGAIVLHTGYTDRFARRTLYLPNLPQPYVDGGLLTDAGQEGLYKLAAMLFMGINEPELDGEMTWLLAFPDVVTPDPANVRGVAFRRIVWQRICSYTAIAPDEVPLDWP